jgi:hypothetical protein
VLSTTTPDTCCPPLGPEQMHGLRIACHWDYPWWHKLVFSAICG